MLDAEGHGRALFQTLIAAPPVPVLLWFYTPDGDVGTGLSFSGPPLALVVGIAVYTDVSYDGTAFASVVATGTRGRADRWGRTLAAGAVALPVVLLAAVLPFVFFGRWEQLPGTTALQGLSFLVIWLIAIGLSSPTIVTG